MNIFAGINFRGIRHDKRYIVLKISFAGNIFRAFPFTAKIAKFSTPRKLILLQCLFNLLMIYASSFLVKIELKKRIGEKKKECVCKVEYYLFREKR